MGDVSKTKWRGMRADRQQNRPGPSRRQKLGIAIVVIVLAAWNYAAAAADNDCGGDAAFSSCDDF